jgi:hypothetical protein
LCYWRAAIRRKNVATCWIQLQLHELQKNMPFKLWGTTTKLPTKITNRIISWNTKPFVQQPYIHSKTWFLLVSPQIWQLQWQATCYWHTFSTGNLSPNCKNKWCQISPHYVDSISMNISMKACHSTDSWDHLTLGTAAWKTKSV